MRRRRGPRTLGSSLLALLALLVLVPLDDRPVTEQLPRLLAAIAGERVVAPPRALLGRYLVPGAPDPILRWLRDEAPADATAFVVSTDMIAYGGLVASRTPATPGFVALSRLRELAAVRAARPQASFSVFGTVMRLAPTGVPALGAAASHFAAGEPVELLTEYANLPDPPQTPAEHADAARLAARLGPTLDAYLATRARNRTVDLFALQQVAEGSYDRIVLGQDDAGPVGLHRRDLAALHAFASRWIPPERFAIEPGADELALILTAAALAHDAGIVPRIRVRYSRADGGTFNDPLEFVPIDTTIAGIIRESGAVRVTAAPDIDLFVRVPATTAADEERFLAAIARAARTDGREPRAAVADLSFLERDDPQFAHQRALVEAMIAAGVAGRLDAFASWNTVANTVGTAVPAAIATAVARRRGVLDPRVHAQFMLDRYIDDYAFHDLVRPALNAALDARGVADHTYLLAPEAARTDADNRAALWRRALGLLEAIYPDYRDGGLTIALPWDRTFETRIDVRLR